MRNKLITLGKKTGIVQEIRTPMHLNTDNRNYATIKGVISTRSITI